MSVDHNSVALPAGGQNAQLAGLFDSFPVAVYSCDAEGRISSYNRRAVEIWGRAPRVGEDDQEFWNRIFNDCSEAETALPRRSLMAEVVRLGRSMRNIELSIPKSNGKRLHLQLDIEPLIEGRRIAGAVCTFADRTEQREAELVLRAKETRFQKLFDRNALGLIIGNSEGKILEANDAFLNLIGYSRQELDAGQLYWTTLTPPEYEHLNEQAQEAINRTGEPGAFEKEYIRKDGTRIPVLVRTASFPDEKIGVALIIDLTEQKRFQEERRKSEERFRALVSQATAGISEVDQAGRFLFANERFCRITGYSAEELLELRMQDISAPEVLPANVELFRKLWQDGTPFTIENEYVRKDGSRVWVNNSVAPARSPGGRTEAAICVTVEVNERRLAEAKLRASEARYRALFESMDEGFCILELIFDEREQPIDYRYVEINPAFEKQTGMTDALGRTIRELVPNIESFWFEIYGKVALMGQPTRFVNRAESMGRWFDVYAFRIGPAEERKVAVLFNDVTAKHEAEERLEYQLQLTQTITSRAAEALFLMDVNGVVTFLNPAAEKMFGWSSHEILGKALHDVLHHHRPDGSPFPMSECPLGRVMTSGESVQAHEDLFFKRDGSPVAVRCSNAPVLNEGKITGAVLVVSDITERKRVEEQLRTSESRYRELFTSMTEGFCVIERIEPGPTTPIDFRFVEANPAFTKQSGVTEVSGRTLRQVIPGEADEWIEIYDRVARTGESMRFERELRALGRMLEVYAYRIGGGGNGQVGIVFHDITERNEIEHKLRAQLRLTQTIANGAGEALFLMDNQGRITFMNPTAEGMFGWRQEDLLGKVLHDAIHYQYPDGRAFPISQCPLVCGMTAGEEVRAHEDVFYARGGKAVFVRCTNAPVVQDGQVTGAVLVVADVTEQKQAEQALAKAQEELREHAADLERGVAERTAKLRETITELETLSYSISHDMRAPLRAMQGFSQALLEDYRSQLDGEGVSHLERISSSAQRLDALIQDILLYTKVTRDQLVLTPLALEPLIRETLETYHPDKASRVSLAPPFPVVLGHQAFLSQIISNLLTNALKFVREGVEPAVQVSCEESAGFVKLWFEDNGIGIAPEHLDRIFHIFGRLHSSTEYPGTGIGLAIVKRAVQRLGGDVGVESSVGKGSRFWVTLKKAQP